MKNGKSLQDAVLQNYAETKWVRTIDNESQLLNCYNHLINRHVQVMDMKQSDQGDSHTYQLLLGKIEELKNMADRVAYFKKITKRGGEAFQEGRRIIESYTILGKDNRSSDGVEYVEPYKADALDEVDTIPFFAAAGCIIDNMLDVIENETGMPKEMLEPKPIALVYHWDANDENGKPECAHIHLVISCKL